MGPSNTLVSRFFPPNNAPRPPLELGLALSLSPPVLGAVALLFGAKASFSLPTGDTPRVFAVASMVFAWRIVWSSVEVAEFTRVASVESVESMVSEAIRGEDSVKRPACD
jgi:hypothetical protein